MLEVSNLTAIRDDRVLFENLQFEIKNVIELVQIEGRNGTGKTTLLRIVTGLGDREEGIIKWKGEEVEKSRDVFHQDLLFLGHQTGVKRELTALKTLRFYQSIHNNRSSEEEIFAALAQVGLAGEKMCL